MFPRLSAADAAADAVHTRTWQCVTQSAATWPVLGQVKQVTIFVSPSWLPWTSPDGLSQAPAITHS